MKKFFYFLMVAFTLSVATLSLTSCEDENRITGYENHDNGPWHQSNNLTIHPDGGGKYTIVDEVSGWELRRSLWPLEDFEFSAPPKVWEIYYYCPYYDTFTEELGWWVETNDGDYWVNPASESWIPM